MLKFKQFRNWARSSTGQSISLLRGQFQIKSAYPIPFQQFHSKQLS
jgi:hypothetical protein